MNELFSSIQWLWESERDREAFGFEMKVIVLFFMCDKVIAIIKLFSLNSFEVENENLIELFH